MKNLYFIKNYAYLTSYDDGVVFTSSVSKFPTNIRARGPKRPSGSRVLFVTSDHHLRLFHRFSLIFAETALSILERGTGHRDTV